MEAEEEAEVVEEEEGVEEEEEGVILDCGNARTGIGRQNKIRHPPSGQSRRPAKLLLL